MDNCPDEIRAASGKQIKELTLQNVLSGKMQPEDCRISSETLRMQADAAEAEGYRQVAQNLRRAAELVSVPDDIVLKTYDMMRPYRSNEEELLGMADRYEADFRAHVTAEFIRESARILKERKLQKRDRGSGDKI